MNLTKQPYPNGPTVNWPRAPRHVYIKHLSKRISETVSKHLISSFLFFAFFATFISIVLVSNSHAQSMAERFGGFSSDSDKPIDIEADRLDVDDKNKTALFRGNVKAVQGGFELRSKTLKVLYAGNAVKGKEGANGKVKKITAKGTVLVTTKDKQTASSDWAEFDVIKQTIVLGDTVILTQGKNIIKGQRLIIDLKTSQSRFVTMRTQNNRDGSKPKKRIQMKVIPGTTKKPQ